MGNKTLIALLFISAGFVSCNKDGGGCFTSTGKTASETRTLDKFEELEISGNVDVEFYPNSSSNYVEVSGGEHLLKGIKTEVSDNRLKITNKNRCNWVRSYAKRITVKIHTKEIKQLEFSGSGDLVFKDTLRTETFTMNAWDASGDVTFLFHTKEVYLKMHTGTANATLYGYTDFAYYYSLANGFIYAQDIFCRGAYVAQNGYGDIYINPTDKLEGLITKSGDVYYRGSSIVKVDQYGSGRLRTF